MMGTTWTSGPKATYVVHRGEVDAIFYSIALEFPVVVYDNLTICVVDGNSLGVAILGLVLSIWARSWSLTGLKYSSSMWHCKCLVEMVCEYGIGNTLNTTMQRWWEKKSRLLQPESRVLERLRSGTWDQTS